MIARDWAIITLAEVLTLKPILWRSIRNADLPSAAEPGEIARAGYSQDRPFLLSMHRGCSIKTDVPQPGSVLHQCDSMPGDSGSPILLLNGEDVSVIGIHTGIVQSFEPGAGYRAKSAGRLGKCFCGGCCVRSSREPLSRTPASYAAARPSAALRCIESSAQRTAAKTARQFSA
jgi:hypothetical protein